jgi:hypothetical protein
MAEEIISEDPNRYIVPIVIIEVAAVVGTYLVTKAVVYDMVGDVTVDPLAAIDDACAAPLAEGQAAAPRCSPEVTELVGQKLDEGENTADTVSDTVALGPALLLGVVLAVGHSILRKERK